MSEPARRSRALTFFGLVILGLIIFWPSRDVLPFLVQGDIGRDLYAYQRTAAGAIPYRDYYYTYGPLMPFYYAAFLKVLGVHISSVLWGKIVLNICSGLLIFLILDLWCSPLFGLLAASWFWIYNLDILHTFNHIGGMPLVLSALYLILRYLKDRGWRWRLWLVPVLTLACLVKLNLGLVLVAASFVSLLMIDLCEQGRWKWPGFFKLAGTLCLPVALAVPVYLSLVAGLPSYYVKQCLPLSSQYLQAPADGNIGRMIGILNATVSSRLKGQVFDVLDLAGISLVPGQVLHWAFAALLVFCGISGTVAAARAWRKKGREIFRGQEFLVATVLLTFIFLSAHEFLLMALQRYQLYWAMAVLIVFVFFVAGTVLREKAVGQVVLAVLVFGFVISDVWGRYEFKRLLRQTPQQSIREHGRTVFIRNPPEWITVADQAVAYLNRHLGPGERFLALPYEPLYYYLTDRPSPVPELVFFDYCNISPVQEQRIIGDMERQKVNYVLISNRWLSPETGLGIFGVDYCPGLAKYISEHFQEEVTFGSWEQRCGWFFPHAVRIFRRVPAGQNP